ncbi:MAG: hydantoinase B/oxoprolinase family protein [Rhizobiaceae bacterium]|nr:hydantoinase B/oxoprolinase family protein [Rhizobiaceae bacterium]
MRFDPITLEVVQNAVSSIADEMALVIMRTAYSPVVRDTMDFSTAVCDCKGLVVAQGLTLPSQLGSFPGIMRRLIETYGETLTQGDLFIGNDPYGAGGQHLPDVFIIKPVFREGVLCGFGAALAHQTDVGGLVPGSVAIQAVDILQEGLCLPLCRLHDAGRPNEAVLAIIEKNTRRPDEVTGDMRAMISACNIAEKNLLELVRRYGHEQLQVYFDHMQSLSHRAMEAAIRDIPDGTYEGVDFIDGVGDAPEPLRIRATITVSGPGLTINFDGTSPQIQAGINCPIALTEAASYCALRCLIGDDIPNCEGYMRAIKVVAPDGCLVNPVWPAACSARGVVGFRVFDTIMRALATIVPERVIAGSEGGPSMIALGGVSGGKPFVHNELIVGAWGARSGKDGLEGVSNLLGNISNQPIELIESQMPIEILSYGFVEDTGGDGEFRGGLAFRREYVFTEDNLLLTLRNDRRAHPPYGIAGGSAGAPSMQMIVRTDGNEEIVPTMPMLSYRVNKGDRYVLQSAGGGGYGDPSLRLREAVEKDLAEGKISRAKAVTLYGLE